VSLVDQDWVGRSLDLFCVLCLLDGMILLAWNVGIHYCILLCWGLVSYVGLQWSVNIDVRFHCRCEVCA
jgi:hypothetical protein